MKLTCLQENLAQGLSTVSRAVATRGSLPVLSNILFEAQRGGLKLSATNLETGILTWVGAKVEKEGSLAVPARIVSELTSSLDPGKISLTFKNQILSIEAANARSQINGMPAEEFPSLPHASGEPLLELSPATFSPAVSQVAFAAATDEGRPILTGIKFTISPSELLLVGVDGFRLSEKKVRLEGQEGKGEASFVIPARALQEAARLISGSEEPLKVYKARGENQVILQAENLEVSSRLLEGTFPDYKKIIPTHFSTKATLSSEELTKAVKLAAIFARDSANIVKLLFNPQKDKLTLSANTAEVGENETDLEAKIEGEGGEVAFNSKYLLDCLGNIEAENITFEMGGSLSPGMIRPLGSTDFLHIIMPVRVQS